ncbi:MAG: NAAT family transporter [Bacteroidota bacterium]|nr:MAG: NAAT family transporter [Bacteroidota bacterium]
MNEYFVFGLLAFTSFFTLVNPLGSLPVFLTMTANLDARHRDRTALKAVLVALITMVFFMYTGKLLFSFFGISINSFRIVGGVIFFIMGMDMLQARLGTIKVQETEIKKYVNDISVTPLAIPLICGPGAITNSIVLMGDADDAGKKIALFIGTLSVLAITYLVYYGGSKLVNILGQTGLNVLTRLMGLIVMVIAVEFFFSGLKPVLLDIFPQAIL